MIPTRETDHVGTGLSLLIEQFKEKRVIEGIGTSWLRRFQEVEDAIWEVIYGLLLPNAVGVQLEALGDLVGEKRLGRADDDYRAAVRLRIRVNRSKGLAEDVIDVANIASNENATYVEFFPAGFEVTSYDLPGQNAVAQMLYSTRAAGTLGVLVTSDFGEDEVAKFDDEFGTYGEVWGSVYSPEVTERYAHAIELRPGIRSIAAPIGLGETGLALNPLGDI